MSNTPENLRRLGDAARAIQRDADAAGVGRVNWKQRAQTLEAAYAETFYMARRYADMRQSYAPSLHNDAVRAVLALGVQLRPDNGAFYARDGGGRSFDRLLLDEVAACEAADYRWPGTDEDQQRQRRIEALDRLVQAAEELADDLGKCAGDQLLALDVLVAELGGMVEDDAGHEAIVPMRLLVPILAALLDVQATTRPPSSEEAPVGDD